MIPVEGFDSQVDPGRGYAIREIVATAGTVLTVLSADTSRLQLNPGRPESVPASCCAKLYRSWPTISSVSVISCVT